MNFDSLLIVTYGRSGSTLLQGLLNSVEGCLVRGENANFCFHLYQSYLALVEAHSMEEAVAPTHPWFGGASIDIQLYLENLSNAIRKVILGEQTEKGPIQCYGFKEINYVRPEVLSDLQGYLEFLERVMPRVCFIFNTRNHKDTLESGWWPEVERNQVLQLFHEFERKVSQFQENRDNTFSITYEEVVSSSERLKSLFETLGLPYDPVRIESVLRTPHSSIRPSRESQLFRLARKEEA